MGAQEVLDEIHQNLSFGDHTHFSNHNPTIMERTTLPFSMRLDMDMLSNTRVAGIDAPGDMRSVRESLQRRLLDDFVPTTLRRVPSWPIPRVTIPGVQKVG